MATLTINLSKQKPVKSQQVTMAAADTQIATFTAAERVNRVIFHAAGAVAYKLTFGLNGVAAAASTALTVADAVGHVVGFGAQVDNLEVITNEGDIITEIRGWASGAVSIRYTAYQPNKSNNANY